MAKVNNLNKFALLLWLRLIQLKRKIWSFINEILFSLVLFILLLMQRRDTVQQVYSKPLRYPDLSLINTTFEESLIVPYECSVIYAPKSPAIEKLMTEVKSKMKVESVKAFINGDELTSYLIQNEEKRPLAGVIFDSIVYNSTTLPDKLDLKLIFPVELRFVNQDKSTLEPFKFWETSKTVHELGVKPRNWEEPLGGPPGYYREKFISLQSAISLSFIEAKATSNLPDLSKIYLKRFSYPPTTIDLFLRKFADAFRLIFMFSYFMSAYNFTKMMANEKEAQLKEFVKIMGLQTWLYNAAWFFRFMAPSLVVSAAIVAIMTAPIFDAGPMFDHTTWSALFVFLCISCLYLCSFSFLMVSIFPKAISTVLVFTLLLFVAMILDSIIKDNVETMNMASQLALCLYPFFGLCLGTMVILNLELDETGFKFNTLFSPGIEDSGLAMVHVMAMMLVMSVVYFLLADYLSKIFPGRYGVPEKWHYPFSKLCSQLSTHEFKRASVDTIVYPEFVEEFPRDKVMGIEVDKLSRKFGDFTAVKPLTVSFFEDEVTVLLGDNGAGKTTTMFMLAGMIPSTSGRAEVNGHDITTELERVRESIGLCPQENILFPDLSLMENILFFSKLKGMSDEEAKTEASRFIDKMKLGEKVDQLPKKLSGGTQRKVCMAVALCGNSKVVLCDEPTSGLDPVSRRLIWDLIESEKSGRTILFSTHFMDEADAIGERIAIMHKGELKCFGTPQFLKRNFGMGYELTLEKGPDCDVDNVTRLIKGYIPNAEIHRNTGAELAYKLSERDSFKFQPMLARLESSMGQIDIEGYGISSSTIEEVFMKVINMQLPDEHDHLEFLHKSSDNISGGELLMNHIGAMFYKKGFITMQNIVTLALEYFIFIGLTLVTVPISRIMFGDLTVNSLPINFDKYQRNSVILIASDDHSEKSEVAKVRMNYEELIKSETNQVILKNVPSISRYIEELSGTDLNDFNRKTIIGASFYAQNITAWFNNQPLHSVPLSVNYVLNAVLKTVCSSCDIKVTNAPLPYTFKTEKDMHNNSSNFSSMLAQNITTVLAIFVAFYAFFYVKESHSRAKLLQYICGVGVFTFWITAFIWDLFLFFLPAFVTLTGLYFCNEDGWNTVSGLGNLAALLVLFMCSVLPIVYMISARYEVPSDAHSIVLIFGFFTGSMISLFIGMMNINMEDIKYYTLVIPYYNILSSTSNLAEMNSIKLKCQSMCDEDPHCESVEELCKVVPICCNLNTFRFEKPGVGLNAIYFGASAPIYFILLLLIETKTFQRIYSYYMKSNCKSDEKVSDDDVKHEISRVKNMSDNEISKHYLVAKDLTKSYGKLCAVNHISLAVNSGETFGLLGFNGAGKTTTFKMLTGDISIDEGDAFVHGISVKSDQGQVYKRIGYCPQFDALFDDMTGRETLKLFCMIRGIPKNQIERITMALAKAFNFEIHLDKKTHQYSGGNKRKLSTAIAVLGNPIVVYLDEPTTGMDPASKRHIWNVIAKYRDKGNAIILTSHSMEECEALCTRLSIMVRGRFLCLGSVQHLKNKFMEAFSLLIQVNRKNYYRDISNVKEYVRSNIPGSELTEEYQGRLTFSIRAGRNWSSIFGTMEIAKDRFDLESYSLSQPNLEQIFLTVTAENN